MKQYISRKIHGVAYRLHKFANSVYTEDPVLDANLAIKEKAHEKWIADSGDRVLRLDYALNEDSVVFDVGGYEGQWASDIHSMYHCYVHVFEPVPQFADYIEWRFRKNDKVLLHRVALGGEDREAKIRVDENASSVIGSDDDSVVIDVRKLSSILEATNVERIALLKINIEGLEYDLLDNILDEGLQERIDNIQVQFHEFVPDAMGRMNRVKAKLAVTHICVYQYPFIWESWARKGL
jgi:FkbM family methyltransferase